MSTTIAIQADTDTIPVVAYASKSSKDEHDAIPSQIASIREAVDRERDGERIWIADPFQEEKRSGWTGDRGPELEAALVAAEDAASTHGSAELWVWKSERLARGSGKKAEARSLLEVFTRCKRAGVTLRSVRDDEYVKDEALIGMASKMANKYSEDLSGAVKDGKARQRERGEVHGGVVCDGYLLLKDDEIKTYALDPERQETTARLFELGLTGMAPAPAARALNAEGHRTREGKPWERRNVEDKWTNAFFAGAVVYFRGTDREEVHWIDGHHPAYISREDFDRLAAMRKGRDRARGSDRSPGRPNERHLLAGLARCQRCEGKMRPITSSYKRKDGTKGRTYLCENVKAGTGLCDAPSVNAELIDAELVGHLSGLFLDADHFLTQLTTTRTREREGIEADRARAADRLAELERRQVKLRERMAAKLAEGADVDVLEDTLSQQRAEARQVEARVAELDGLLDAPADSPADAVLDFWNDLRGNVQGVLSRNRIPEVRAGLAETFAAFHIDTTPEGIGIYPELQEGIPAVVHLEATRSEGEPRCLARLVTFDNSGEADPFPTFIDPAEKVGDSHE
jgi:site-specific DNA recombinase